MPRSNTFYKIISVIIAVILWSYVIVEVNPTSKQTIKDVPVQLINEENLTARELAIYGDTDYKVDVTVEGKRGDIAKIKPDEIIANADLFGFTIGKNYIPVTVTVPDSLEVVEIKSSKIVVNIEDLVAASKPVKVSFTGTTKENTEIGDISTQPEEIEVSGAKSYVSQVSNILVEVDSSKFTKSGNKIQAEAIPLNSDGDPVNNVSLSSDYVDVSAKLYNIKEVKLNVEVSGEAASFYEIKGINKPSTIKIKGSKDDLKDITEISAEPIDITGTKTTANIKIKPILPKDIEIASDSKNLVVNIQIKGITTRYFDYSASEIGIENLPENLSADIQTDKITIKVSASEAVIANLSKGDFKPYINLANAAKETTSTAVLVNYNKQVNNIEISPANVQILLSEVEQ